jgi:hypothetical protein
MIPGGFGLLYLARGLAWRRCHGELLNGNWEPYQRHIVESYHGLAQSHEYYAILDRIARGERP